MEDIQKLAGETWPKGAFERTEVREGSPLTQYKKEDLVIMEFIYMKEVSQTVKPGGEEKPHQKMIYLVPLKSTEDAEILEAVIKIGEIMGKEGRDKIVIPKIPGVSTDRLAKLIEFAWYVDRQRKGIICTPPQTAGPGSDKENTITRRRNEQFKDTNAIVVRSENKEYKELIKDVKETLMENEFKSQVRAIRSSGKGEMIITMDKDDKGADCIKEAIMSKLQQVKARVAGTSNNADEMTLNIRNLDTAVNAKEIEEAIKEALPGKAKVVHISGLRPTYGDTQSVTVKLDCKSANKLLKREFIKIEVVRAKVDERVQPLQWLKCWQYGHKSANCVKLNDRTNTCFKCGGLGHTKKDCVESNYCLTCQTKEHSTGSSRCPAYRKALRDQKEARKKVPLRDGGTNHGSTITEGLGPTSA